MEDYRAQTTIQLSIVIATYNRCETLWNCLAALFSQTQPFADFEIVVVVDGSSDGTSEMLSQLASPCQMQVVEQANSGQTTALNRGAAVAIGRYCLFLDDDIVANPELVSAHLQVQHEHRGLIGIGHLLISLPSTADGLASYFSVWWTGHYARLADGRPPSAMDCFGGNLSVPLDAFRAVGGYAVDLPRLFDIELGYRLHAWGLSLTYIPNAIARQDFRKEFNAMCVDIAAEGRAELLLYQRHPPLLPGLRIGRFSEGPWHVVLLLRLLLCLRVPLGPLQMASRLIDRTLLAPNWYQFILAYRFWHGVRCAVPDHETWRQLTGGTVILMYHAFGRGGEKASRYVVPARRFAQQMGWLKRRHYCILSLDEYLDHCRAYRLPPKRSVVITVDDGYADTHSVAYPVLRRLDFPATVFLVSRHLGTCNSWDQGSELTGRPLLSVALVQDMANGGIAIGAHTQTHPILSAVHPLEAREQISNSRRDLQRDLQAPINVFAYPYGKQNSVLQTLVEEAGYDGAVGISSGWNCPATSWFNLRRVEIRGTYSFIQFLIALWLGRAGLRAHR